MKLNVKLTLFFILLLFCNIIIDLKSQDNNNALEPKLRGGGGSFSITPRIDFGYFFPTKYTVISGQDFMSSRNIFPPLFVGGVIDQQGKQRTLIFQHGGYGLEFYYHHRNKYNDPAWSIGIGANIQKHLYKYDVPDFYFKGNYSTGIVDFYRYSAYKISFRKTFNGKNIESPWFLQFNAAYTNNFKSLEKGWQKLENIPTSNYVDSGNGYTAGNLDILKSNYLFEFEVGKTSAYSDKIDWSIGVSIPVKNPIFKSDITYYENFIPTGTVRLKESQLGVWFNVRYHIELAKWNLKPRFPKPPKSPKPPKNQVVNPVVINDRKTNVQHTYATKSDDLIIEIFDSASADGDTASLWFNGAWILENYPVNKEPKQLSIHLKQGENDLTLYAISLGITPPNTAAITIIDGEKRKTLILNSDYNHCGAIRIFKE